MSADYFLIAKFAELECCIDNLGNELYATSVALDALERIHADARLKFLASMKRCREATAEVAVIKEMLRVQ